VVVDDPMRAGRVIVSRSGSWIDVLVDTDHYSSADRCSIRTDIHESLHLGRAGCPQAIVNDCELTRPTQEFLSRSQ